MANSIDSAKVADEGLLVRRPKRFGWLALCIVAGAAFWAGAVAYARIRKTYEADLRLSFPFMVQLNSPVMIRVEWNAVESKIPGSELYKAYSGTATYIVKNQSDRTIKLAFPPQNCFRFSDHEMTPRNPDHIPKWARERFVLTLKPGEKREYEEDYTITACCVSDRRYGPFAFDFAAPGDADPTEYVTGTVLCSMRANVEAK